MKNKFLISFLIVVIILFSCNVKAQVFNVKDYGAKGDGKTNDYLAIFNAVKALNKAGKGKLIFSKGVYYIANYNSINSNYDDIEFNNLSMLNIVGNGSKIVINGNFHRKAERVKNNFSYSFSRTITPLSIAGCRNVTISDLEIDGGAKFTTRDKKVVESGGRLLVISNSQNLTLKNLYIHHALTDGIYVSNNSSNISGDNLNSSNNARQGISLIQGSNITIQNSKFNSNGNTEGSYLGHNPMSGLDIEPSNGKGVFDVIFNKCEFKNNVGSQVLITNPEFTNNIKIENSNIIAGTSLGSYQLILAGKGVTLANNKIDCGKGNLYALWNNFPNSELYLLNNKIFSSNAGIVAVSKKPGAKVVIDGNTIVYTGNAPVNKYFPYIVADIEFNNNKVLIEKLRSKGVNSLIKVKRFSNNTFTDGKKVFSPNISID